MAMAVGCAHQEPLAHHEPRADTPFTASQPIRLTYNIATDASPAWSFDGRRLYYSAHDSARSDHDACIVTMPSTGGTRTAVQCPALGVNDTSELLERPAPGPDLLAWSRSELGVVEHSSPRHSILAAVPVPDAPVRLLLRFPYATTAGHPHDMPLFLQWLRPGVLLYLGASFGTSFPDTVWLGDQVTLLNLTAPVPTLDFVAGTSGASAVSASPDGTSIYYTITGDTRVLRQDLSTGLETLVHDFGAAGIARDPSVVGQRLAAIVGGQPGLRDFPLQGLGQVDRGGHLVLVDLQNGAETVVPDGDRLYRRPALSPDGSRMVAEGFPYVVTPILDSSGAVVGADTVTSRRADLWLFEE